MHLSPNEVVLRIFYHHYFPFAKRLVLIIASALPFYVLLFILAGAFPKNVILLLHLGIVIIFTLAVIYSTLVYWLDRLIITNRRVIFIDWKYLTKKGEYEAKLEDLQDIRTLERGILAKIPFLDYGTIEIRTASDRTVIDFPEAPNPESIRQFIYKIKHHD